MRDGFVLHEETMEQLAEFTDEEAGQLLKALIAHYKGEGRPETERIVRTVLVNAESRMDSDKDYYDRQAANGAKNKRTEAKQKPNASQTEAKKSQTEAKPKPEPSQNEPSVFDFDYDSEKKDISGISDEIPRHPEADPEDLGEVMDAWNGIESIPPIKTLGTTRKRLLKARLREYGLPAVLNAVENIRGSTFLQGDNKNQWVITFDWFVKPSNFAKVLEGNYKNKASPSRLDVVDSWV